MALKSVADGVFAESHGSGEPVVIALHGWGRRGTDFDQALDGLDALAVDLPGFGASPPPANATGARGYASMIEPVLAGLVRAPVLVGHSFGGRVAVSLAARLPVAGLVLTGVPLVRTSPPGRPPLSYRLARWAHRRGMVSDARMDSERRRRGSADYVAASGVMRDVLVATVNESYEQELGVVGCPVTLVWGSEDRDVLPAVGERAEATLRARGVPVELTVLDDVGHLVPTEAPDALRSAIDRMIGP